MLLQRAQKKVSMVLILVLLFTMLVPTMVSGATGVPLKDIGGSYAQNEIQSLVDRGIISGYEDGTFQPAKAMSRAEMAKILALSLNLKEQPDQASGFSDVAPSSWYRGYVGAILKYGITQGTSANTFSPDDSVTREELVVFFIRAMGLEDMAAKIPADAQLADLSTVSIWARNSVSLACKIGFVNGVEQNGVIQFNPKEKAERQALARLAYEFISNKDKFVEKANALINTTASDNITEITAVNSTSVEVSFSKDQPAVALSDFSLNGLKIVKAELKTDSRTVVVLTTDAQTAGTIYTLSYKGKDTGKTFTGFAAAMGGGGFGGGFGGGAGTVTTTDLQKINAGGIYPSLTITTSGTIGPADGTTTTVTGTLTLDPGVDGEITLQNVRADQILVASGSSNSIKLKNTIINTLKVASSNQSNSTRIETLEGSQVTNTLIQSKVIIESTAGSLGMIQIGYGAAGQVVELRGTIQSNIIVNSSSTTIKIATPNGGGTTSVANLNLSSQATVSVASGAVINNVSITSSRAAVQFTGEGQIHNLTVSKEAEGATLNLATANITSLKLEANVSLAGDAATIGSLPITAAPGVVVTVPAGVAETLKTDAITAIAAIGMVTQYSAEIESKIQIAETKANNAIILGIRPEDIPGCTTTLVTAKSAITNYALQIALDKLQIGYFLDETYNAVAHNIILPSADPIRGVLITWSSSNPSIISSEGKVTLPAVGQPNGAVTLTATASKNGTNATQTFYLTVLPQLADTDLISLSIEPTSIALVKGYLQQLRVTGIYSNQVVRSLTGDATYTSSHPDIATVSPEGMVAPIANGTSEITATYKGLTARTTVTVNLNEIRLNGVEGVRQAILFWNDLGPGVTYEIYSSNISGLYSNPPVTTLKTNYVATELDSGIDYFFIVKAQFKGSSYTSSEVHVVPAREIPPTSKPTVTGTVYTNGWMLTGVSESYTNDQHTQLMLSKKDGTPLYHSIAEPSGVFKMIPNYQNNLEYHLEVGEEVGISAMGYGKSWSEPVTFIVQQTTGQTITPWITDYVNEVSNITGTAEPGAIVYLQYTVHSNGYPDENRVSATVASMDGRFTFYGYEGQFQTGDELIITAAVLGKGTSDPIRRMVQAATVTATPIVLGSVYPNSWKLHGTGEPSTQNEYTYVTLSKLDGSHIVTGSIGTDGQFTLEDINLYNDYLLLNPGDVVILTAQAEGKKKSIPIQLIVQTPVAKTSPVMLDTTNDALISGWAEYGSHITITGKAGSKKLITRASLTTGWFSLELPKNSYVAGDQLSITATVIGQESSNVVSATLDAALVTETPTVTGSIYPNSYNLTGTMEPGAIDSYTSVTLSKSNGSWGHGDSGYLGTFKMSGLFDTSTNLTVGEEFLLTATAYGKKKSEPVRIIVQPVSGQTGQPAQLEARQAFIAGKAEPDAYVSVTSPYTGLRITAIPVLHDGTFYFDTSSFSLQEGEVLSITATSLGKATSEPVQAIVQASPKTQTPTVTGTVYTNMYMLNGTINEDSYFTISLGTFKVGSFSRFGGWNGEFSSSNLVLYYSLVAGEEVLVTAQTNGELRSDPVRMTVKATEGKTEIPTYDKLTQDGYFTGTAEPGSIIMLTDDASGRSSTGTASSGGKYSIPIYLDYLRPGDQLSITATAPGKATSDTVHITIVED